MSFFEHSFNLFKGKERPSYSTLSISNKCRVYRIVRFQGGSNGVQNW
jgi:hypothetical protein